MVATAALGVLIEKIMWGPMRAQRAGLLQLLLMSIGLAFLIRYGDPVRSGAPRCARLDVNVTDTVQFLGLRIGAHELIVIVVGVVVLARDRADAAATRLLGKRMRALSDDLDLAETAGIDTSRVILYTWIFAGALAGLAGVLAGALTTLQPELGFTLLLPIFAAVILGGHRRRVRRPRGRAWCSGS